MTFLISQEPERSPRPSLSLVLPADPFAESMEDYRESDKQLLLSWRRALWGENKREETLTSYLQPARRFIRFSQEQGWPVLSGITTEHIDRYLGALRSSGRVKGISLNSYYRMLLQFFTWLAKRGHIKTNPLLDIKPPRYDESVKDIVPIEAMTRLFKQLVQEQDWRRLSLIACFYDTGCRTGELMEAERSWVHLDAGILAVPANVAKGRRARTVGLSPSTVQWLENWLLSRTDEQPELFLDSRRHPFARRQVVYMTVRKQFDRLGLGQGVKIGGHDLRHTWATELSKKGISMEHLMALGGWVEDSMPRRYTKTAINGNALAVQRQISNVSALPMAAAQAPKRGRPRKALK